MKTILLLLFCLAATCLNAQIVNIPDANFKTALIQHGVDTNNDGEIQINEAESITGTIHVSNQGINDLTGIEAFINIQQLNCSGNQLMELDVSQNVHLTLLYCFDNQLTQLDVSQNVELETLFCGFNPLVVLDLSNNINLTFLYCENAQLSDLDLRNGIHETGINVITNPYLSCIFVDDTDFANNSSWWYKDPTATYVETQEECDDIASVVNFGMHQIKIYPNPVKNRIHIDSPVPFDKLEIYNLKGKEVFSAFSQKSKNEFNLTILPAGIYLLKLTTENTQLIRKIIKL